MQTFKKILLFMIINFTLIVFCNACLKTMLPNRSTGMSKDLLLKKPPTIVVGQSQGETSINPTIYQTIKNEPMYNCARALMPVCNIEYIIKLANHSGKLKRVIWEMDGQYWKASFTSSSLSLLPELPNKIEYFTKIILPYEWSRSIMDVLSPYQVSLASIKQMPSNIERRFLHKKIKSIFYQQHSNGFLRGIKRDNSDWSITTFKSEDVLQQNIESFRSIAQYCKRNQIELIGIRVARTPFFLYTEASRQESEFFSKLCHESDIKFYDLNLVDKKFLFFTNDDFVDGGHHSMGYLADKQTKVLCDILKSDDPSQFFYKSYDEVLANLPPEEKVAPIREKTHD